MIEADWRNMPLKSPWIINCMKFGKRNKNWSRRSTWNLCFWFSLFLSAEEKSSNDSSAKTVLKNVRLTIKETENWFQTAPFFPHTPHYFAGGRSASLPFHTSPARRRHLDLRLYYYQLIIHLNDTQDRIVTTIQTHGITRQWINLS